MNLEKKSPPKYCGKKCQASFASSQRLQSSYKGKCVDCGKEIIISSFDPRKEHRCVICAKKRTAKKEKINKSLRKQEIAKSINESEKVNDLYYISTFEGPFRCAYCGEDFYYDFRKSPFERHRSRPKFCSEKCKEHYDNERSLKSSNSKKLINISKCKKCRDFFEKSIYSTKKICPACEYLDFSYRDEFLIAYHFYMRLSLKEENHFYSLCEAYFRKYHLKFSCFNLINNDKSSVWKELREHRLIGASSHSRRQYKENFLREKLEAQKPSSADLFYDFITSEIFQEKSAVLRKLGYNFESENSAFDEYLKVKHLFEEEYLNQKMSLLQFSTSHGITYNLSEPYFYLFGIPKRDYDTAWLSRKYWRSPEEYRTTNSSFNFKRGYHLSWENKRFFFMSSYEFEFAKALDNLRISYEVGTLILPYFSSKENRIVNGRPDFILEDYKIIIEIKGSRFYDPQDLKERQQAALESNYKFFVFLNKKLILSNFPPLEELNFDETSISASFKELEDLLDYSFKGLLYI